MMGLHEKSLLAILHLVLLNDCDGHNYLSTSATQGFRELQRLHHIYRYKANYEGNN